MEVKVDFFLHSNRTENGWGWSLGSKFGLTEKNTFLTIKMVTDKLTR